jgi:hypothetical protein
MQSKAIKLTRLTRVAQDAKHCMVWDAIEGDRTHPFDSGFMAIHLNNMNQEYDSGSAGCQALHGLG